MLPHQRRWKKWFPEVMCVKISNLSFVKKSSYLTFVFLLMFRYYYANADKTREYVQVMINEKKWNDKEFPELRKDLLNKININIQYDPSK